MNETCNLRRLKFISIHPIGINVIELKININFKSKFVKQDFVKSNLLTELDKVAQEQIANYFFENFNSREKLLKILHTN